MHDSTGLFKPNGEIIFYSNISHSSQTKTTPCRQYISYFVQLSVSFLLSESISHSLNQETVQLFVKLAGVSTLNHSPTHSLPQWLKHTFIQARTNARTHSLTHPPHSSHSHTESLKEFSVNQTVI